MPTATAPVVTSQPAPFLRNAKALRGLPPVRSVPGKVRLVKDLLRVGSWPVGVNAAGKVQRWDVTTGTLLDIASVFRRQKQEGQTRPLQWGHADPENGHANVDARNVIDYWDDLIVEGKTLWGIIYVLDSIAAEITRVNRPVSVAVDYLGRVMTPGTVTPVRNSLLHVGIVDQGAMPGQGPFVQMGSVSPKVAKEMAELTRLFGLVGHPPERAARMARNVIEKAQNRN